MKWGILASLVLGAMLLVLPIAYGYPAQWSIVLAGSAVALGSISALVYARRLLFAAASTPHAAFFAASLGIILASSVGGSPLLWTLAIGMVVVYALGYMAFRGVDPDDATALVVSFTTSAGVLAAFYVLSNYAQGVSIMSVVIGDPLLATREEVLLASVIAVVVAVLALTGSREISYMGLDRDDARLSGVRTWFYDLILYTVMGLAIVGLVRVIGFIVEHVLVLLPGAIALSRAKSSLEGVLASIGVTLLASGMSLAGAILLNLSPGGVIGLILVIAYAVIVLAGRGGRGG